MGRESARFYLSSFGQARSGALLGSTEAVESRDGETSPVAITVHDQFHGTASLSCVPGETTCLGKLCGDNLDFIVGHHQPSPSKIIGLISCTAIQDPQPVLDC